jgi:hypothetical protein
MAGVRYRRGRTGGSYSTSIYSGSKNHDQENNHTYPTRLWPDLLARAGVDRLDLSGAGCLGDVAERSRRLSYPADGSCVMACRAGRQRCGPALRSGRRCCADGFASCSRTQPGTGCDCQLRLIGKQPRQAGQRASVCGRTKQTLPHARNSSRTPGATVTVLSWLVLAALKACGRQLVHGHATRNFPLPGFGFHPWAPSLRSQRKLTTRELLLKTTDCRLI